MKKNQLMRVLAMLLMMVFIISLSACEGQQVASKPTASMAEFDETELKNAEILTTIDNPNDLPVLYSQRQQQPVYHDISFEDEGGPLLTISVDEATFKLIENAEGYDGRPGLSYHITSDGDYKTPVDYMEIRFIPEQTIKHCVESILPEYISSDGILPKFTGDAYVIQGKTFYIFKIDADEKAKTPYAAEACLAEVDGGILAAVTVSQLRESGEGDTKSYSVHQNSMKDLATVLMTLKIHGGSDAATLLAEMEKLEVLPVKHEAAEQAAIEIIRLESGKRIEPSMPEGIYSYYSAIGHNRIYLDVITDVTNLGASEATANELLQVSVFSNGSTYTGFPATEEEDGSDFDDKIAIAPSESARVHFLIEVPNTVLEQDMLLTFEAGQESFPMRIAYAELEIPKEYYAVGDMLTAEGYPEIKLANVDYVKEQHPKNTAGGGYMYYEADEGKVYLRLSLEATFENAEQVAKLEEMSVWMVNGEKREFAFPIYEANGRRSLRQSPPEDHDPSEVMYFYYLYSVDESAVNREKELVVCLGDEKKYITVVSDK